MDNVDKSETNPTVNDSAYANSSGNSQSWSLSHSHKSKSSHSNSSYSSSSGYGGKQSTSASSDLPLPPQWRNKKKEGNEIENAVPEVQNEVEMPAESEVNVEVSQEETPRVEEMSSPVHPQAEIDSNNVNISNPPKESLDENGFSCVISMHDGVVMYTSSTVTTSLGFPKDMWVGRSFIDFVHPNDRNTFASQITKGLVAPKNSTPVHNEGKTQGELYSKLFCRIRRYRGLVNDFKVKGNSVKHVPFQLKLSFKNISDKESKDMFLVIRASPVISSFKVPNEVITKDVSFIIRHNADGTIEYVEPEAVTYLGYLPQDIINKNALQLYHPEDLIYLRQIYEVIVKEGTMPRCKGYRLKTQNGEFLKVETEWSSYINPWSRKLEFVTVKHHVVEGPTNPDVFQMVGTENEPKLSEEKMIKSQTLIEDIIRIMNEVLTKPAKMAKQQMSKHCQDFASFMENFWEDSIKMDEELPTDTVHAPETSKNNEQESLVHGRLSPYQHFSDSVSSTDTPLSYNQLTYNENLQRYFMSLAPYSNEDNALVVENKTENPLESNETSDCVRRSECVNLEPVPMDMEHVTTSESTEMADGYQSVWLTKAILDSHNIIMERSLTKKQREHGTGAKEERKKSYANKKKMKEHLARCNASYKPTATISDVQVTKLAYGSKRPMKHNESSQKHKKRRHHHNVAQNSPATPAEGGIAWASNPACNFMPAAVGVAQQMPVASSTATVQGVFPMYYMPGPSTTQVSTRQDQPSVTSNSSTRVPAVGMQYMVYGQAMIGSPFIYSTVNPTVPYPLQEPVSQVVHHTNAPCPLLLTQSNYEEACKMSSVPRTSRTHSNNFWRHRNRKGSRIDYETNAKQGSEDSSMSSLINSYNRAPKTSLETAASSDNKGTIGARTDGESSYSSFYSSFFNTDSAEDSGEAKNTQYMSVQQVIPIQSTYQPNMTASSSKVLKRKADAPWNEQVCVTSELIYKYQIVTENIDEVLSADLKKITAVEQPSLVDEQLGQLYLDLQLQGVTARLSLEDGITSSTSSGEDSNKGPKVAKRKHDHAKMEFLYEENAPFPSPEQEEKQEVEEKSTKEIA